MMGSSASSSNADDSDTEGSSIHVPTKRFKIFRRMRRKSGASSIISPSVPSTLSSPSTEGPTQTVTVPLVNLDRSVVDRNQRRLSNAVFTVSGDEADTDGENDSVSRVRDFEAERGGSSHSAPQKIEALSNEISTAENAVQFNGGSSATFTEKPQVPRGPMTNGSSHVEPNKTITPRNRPTINTLLETSFIPEEEPELSRTSAIVILLITTAFVAVCAEFLLDALPAMLEKSSISQAFIGLVVLPVIGNAAEMVTAVKFAAKNKMDLSIKVAFGSSIQIGL